MSLPNIANAISRPVDEPLVFAADKNEETFEKVLRIYYSAPFWGIRMFGAILANNIKSSSYKRGARSSAG